MGVELTAGVGVGVAMGVAVGVGVNGGVGRGCGVGRGLAVALGVGVGVGVGPEVYSSALATGKIKQQPAAGTSSDQERARSWSGGKEALVVLSPAATRTMPLGSKVAV